MRHFVRVITVDLEQLCGSPEDLASDEAALRPDGEHPDLLAKRCAAVLNYVMTVRLPVTLKGLKVWVEPRVRAQVDRIFLDLLLFYSGQLPLQFRASKNKSPNACIQEEMNRLAGSIEAALERSNGIWNLVAEIVNEESDAAGEVEHVRVQSGYKAPARPRGARIPEIVQFLGIGNKVLPLFTPDLRPELLESTELVVQASPSLNSSRLKLCVEGVSPSEDADSASTRVRPSARLAARWPGQDQRPWLLLAWLSKFMETPMSLRGHAVISVETLEAKALEVQEVENALEILLKLLQFLKPVINTTTDRDAATRIAALLRPVDAFE
ncbi:hypothetical protein ACS5PN_27875 [Roseateles sp. NT4]|uniref:hypothetical protein n=1 Tax=Roseateles sp. NT4 TaxID=3453715 RepID=UPI003EEB1200